MAEVDDIIEQPSDSQKRIKDLSGKVETVAGERDAEKAKREEAETKLAVAERKAAFADEFSNIVSENPAAKDFRADIEAKVVGGYTASDATFAVLGAAGKLGQQKSAVQANPAGGSATTTLPPQGMEKSIGEMTQAERRAELMSRADLGDILAPRSQRQ